MTRSISILFGVAVLLLGMSFFPTSRPLSAEATGPKVQTPITGSLPFTYEGGIRTFHLRAEPIPHVSFYSGFVRGGVTAWGYNGSTPGPTIEANEGEPIRVYFENHLSIPTTVHWHGIELPNNMDGQGGVNQEPVPPGGSYTYEFTPPKPGTFMYHSGEMESLQAAMGLGGFFIVHPRSPVADVVDQDFALFLQIWYVPPLSNQIDAMAMTDFNYFTLNGKSGPEVPHLKIQRGQRVRIRLANLSEMPHPIHLHGFNFTVVGTDGGVIPPSARWPASTVLLGPGETRTIEFTADRAGNWPLHCHFLHHIMNDMHRPPVPGRPMNMDHMGGMFTVMEVLP